MSQILQSLEAANSEEFCIRGVEIKGLKTFPDDRGFFREVIRYNDPFFAGTDSTTPVAPRSTPFGQWSHSKMTVNTVKAWHHHHVQTDWWYCGIGILHVVLFDLRENSPTWKRKMEFLLGDTDEPVSSGNSVLTAVAKIPPGVAHGLRVQTNIAHLFYVTSETYNPQDEGRYPFHCAEIPHSWGNERDLIVADNDRRLFAPTAPKSWLR